MNSCPAGGVTGGAETCYSLMVSCDSVTDFSAYLKVNVPPTPSGTVIFGVGQGGSGLYDTQFAFGTNVVGDVLNAHFITVQVSFGEPFNSATPHGWLTGPGGVRRLACRYATVANWVYNHPQIINPNTAAGTSAPMCATGNSGGSGALAYAVSEYGLDSIFTMIEPTSGPPMARLDQGCSPCSSSVTGLNACTDTQQEMCYVPADAAIIDTAYAQNLCTDAINGGTPNTNLFLSDSVVHTPTIRLPNTTVKILFGDLDTSNAVPQGTVWGTAVSPAPVHQCVPNAPHGIPDVLNGAQQIASDITTLCVVH
jgi:hypothetical protein